MTLPRTARARAGAPVSDVGSGSGPRTKRRRAGGQRSGDSVKLRRGVSERRRIIQRPALESRVSASFLS